MGIIEDFHFMFDGQISYYYEHQVHYTFKTKHHAIPVKSKKYKYIDSQVVTNEWQIGKEFHY